eukprot:Clim_evm38s199 gene=Clim_evmTU38s199
MGKESKKKRAVSRQNEVLRNEESPDKKRQVLADPKVREHLDELKRLKENLKKKHPKSGDLKTMTKDDLMAKKEAVENTGVIYLSTIPPFMKIIKLRHLLSEFGDIGRIYLVEEDEKIRKKRMKMGGNRKKKYVEGWVEFLDKKQAKKTALALNNQIIGGKKSNFYHDDIWNMKYLPKFKWHHLTDALREQRIKEEQSMQSARRDIKKTTEQFLEDIDRSKMIADIEKRKRSKRASAEEQDTEQDRKRMKRTFTQKAVRRNANEDSTATGLLKDLFG